MIGLRKKQPFSLKNLLTVDFALPLRDSEDRENLQKRLQALRGLGVQRVILASEPISLEDTNEVLALQEAPLALPKVEGISVKIVPTYCLDEAFETYVKQNALVGYRDKYILLELHNINSIRGLKGPIFEIRARGYEPVLLHHDPKQYVSIKVAALEYLSDLGCLLQLNLMVLAGAYGQQAKASAETLLSSRFVHVLTTGISKVEDIDQIAKFTMSTNLLSALEDAIAGHNMWLAEA